MPQASADEVKTGNDKVSDRADSVSGENGEEKKGKLAKKIDELRAQHAWLDHLMIAGTRYGERNGDMYAASITYFSFLAIFPLLLFAVAVLGFLLRNDPALYDSLNKTIGESMPGGVGEMISNALTAAREQATSIGIISFVLVAYTGTGWVANIRKATQEMWGHTPQNQNFIKEKLRDLGTLAGLGLALLLSVALSTLAGDVTTYLVKLIRLDGVPGASFLMKAIAIAVALLADTVIFLYVIVTLPRQKMPFRAVLRGAVLGAVGFEILKIVGTVYIPRVAASPAAGVFGAVLGLLIWINLMSRLMLLVLTWTATSRRVLEIRRQQSEVTDSHDEGARRTEQQVRAVMLAARQQRTAYSPKVVFGVLIAIGAVIGSLIPGFVRRWWNSESE